MFNQPFCHLYICRYSDWDINAITQQWMYLLNDQEQDRYHRIRHQDTQTQHLIARVLLRKKLAEITQIAPENVCFNRNEFGRPSLVNSDRKIDFNVSHTQGIVIAAITNCGKVGVDIEIKKRKNHFIDIAEHYFHAKEVLALKEAGAEQIELFFKIWTLKEAYVKALGVGLQKSLSSFYFEINRQNKIHLIDEQETPASKKHNITGFNAPLFEDFYLSVLQQLPPEQSSVEPKMYFCTESFDTHLTEINDIISVSKQ
ncbi:4'-phosphopantetheinyl transferase family protein [Sessilibacter sp. MAH2]